jgi:6,7-dimethyl-8-ribityllumazine synthase
MHRETEASFSAAGLRIAIAVSRYHDVITGPLRDAAVACYTEAGGMASDLEVVTVPGAFELTAAARLLASGDDVDAVVALGCILSGETTHDRYIASAVAHGLTMVTVETGVPVAFGVLTCQSLAQARERAGGEHGNKGTEAMAAAIEIAHLARTHRRPRVGGGG